MHNGDRKLYKLISCIKSAHMEIDVVYRCELEFQDERQLGMKWNILLWESNTREQLELIVV